MHIKVFYNGLNLDETCEARDAEESARALEETGECWRGCFDSCNLRQTIALVAQVAAEKGISPVEVYDEIKDTTTDPATGHPIKVYAEVASELITYKIM